MFEKDRSLHVQLLYTDFVSKYLRNIKQGVESSGLYTIFKKYNKIIAKIYVCRHAIE